MTDAEVTPSELRIVGGPMLELLNGFIRELREAGLPDSLTENLDAMEAIKHIPLEDRDAFKYALAATLVKNHAHWRAFETVFEVYFSLRGKRYAIGDDADELSDLLVKLRDWATKPQFSYRHKWTVGDTVIWDNTGTMHRATPYDPNAGRRLHRTKLQGEEAFS